MANSNSPSLENQYYNNTLQNGDFSVINPNQQEQEKIEIQARRIEQEKQQVKQNQEAENFKMMLLEDNKWIEIKNNHKKYLLSKEYQNFWRLTNEEKERYLKMHENAYKYYLAWDLSESTKKKIKAYEYLRTLYKIKSDKEFLDSVQKIHWARNAVSLENILKRWKNIQYDISTEWYHNESFSSAWWNGIWLKLSGETLMAANTDLRSDNRIGSKEEGSFKKYSYGDTTSIILYKENFLSHNDLQYTDIKWKIHKCHNEFLINNATIDALVIDKTNAKLTQELEEAAISLAKKYGIEIIYNN